MPDDFYLDGVRFDLSSRRSRGWSFRVFPDSVDDTFMVLVGLGFAGGRGLCLRDDSPASARIYGGDTILGVVFFDHPMGRPRLGYASCVFVPTRVSLSEWRRWAFARCGEGGLRAGRSDDLVITADFPCEFGATSSRIGGRCLYAQD